MAFKDVFLGITFTAYPSVTGKSQIKTAAAFADIAAAVAAAAAFVDASDAAAAASVDDAACTG